MGHNLFRRPRLRPRADNVVELSPMYDNPSQITALLAATILAELLALKAASRAPIDHP